MKSVTLRAKLSELIIKCLIYGGAAFVAVVVAEVSIKFLGPENKIEEAVEDVIKSTTGVDVEFSKPTDTTKTP